MQGCLAKDPHCTDGSNGTKSCGGFDGTAGAARMMFGAYRFPKADDCDEGAPWCASPRPANPAAAAARATRHAPRARKALAGLEGGLEGRGVEKAYSRSKNKNGRAADTAPHNAMALSLSRPRGPTAAATGPSLAHGRG